MVKYSKNMARPRQWAKKFNPIHKQLKVAAGRYKHRAGVRTSNKWLGRYSAARKEPFHKQLGYGKWKLNNTKCGGFTKTGALKKWYGGLRKWKVIRGRGGTYVRPKYW